MADGRRSAVDRRNLAVLRDPSVPELAKVGRGVTRPPVVNPADRAEMIGVESYIDELRGECEDQTQKIAQLERQLDDLRAAVRELMGTSG